jgi:cation transport ATPase
MIDSKKVYEVSLLEKGDLIELSAGMKLLCDGVILKGEVKYLC